jgi:hypothetical protein
VVGEAPAAARGRALSQTMVQIGMKTLSKFHPKFLLKKDCEKIHDDAFSSLFHRMPGFSDR